MMISKESRQEKLIITSMENLAPRDRFLCKLDAAVDFGFIIYDLVKSLYSRTGRSPVDPVVLVKMLLIGYLYGIDSERKLAEEVRYNISYR